MNTPESKPPKTLKQVGESNQSAETEWLSSIGDNQDTANGSAEWALAPEANQENFDRRSRTRKKPPKTSYRIQVQRFLNSIVYKIHASRLFQFLFVVITAAAVALIWYSATHRAVLIEEAHDQLVVQGQLETEILGIRQIWSEDKMNEISQGVASADQRRVFSDYHSLATWLGENSTYANQLYLDFSYTLGEGTYAQIDNTLEIPISVILKPDNTNPQQTYFQMMEFARHMVSSPWYVDIQEASVESRGAGITELKAQISVWVRRKVKSDG